MRWSWEHKQSVGKDSLTDEKLKSKQKAKNFRHEVDRSCSSNHTVESS